jgi:hypothetical protein
MQRAINSLIFCFDWTLAYRNDHIKKPDTSLPILRAFDIRFLLMDFPLSYKLVRCT